MLDKVMQLFERLLALAIVLALLPCVVGSIIHSIGTVELLLMLAIWSVAAYLRNGSRPPIAGGRRAGKGAERIPLPPKGDG